MSTQQEDWKKIYAELGLGEVKILTYQNQLGKLRKAMTSLHSRLLTLEQQRDELLEALENVMYCDNGKPEWESARAAIKKATGEKE